MKIWLTSYVLNRMNKVLDSYEVTNVTEFVEKATMEALERLEGVDNERKSH